MGRLTFIVRHGLPSFLLLMPPNDQALAQRCASGDVGWSTLLGGMDLFTANGNQ
jgi:hypothetical protein